MARTIEQRRGRIFADPATGSSVCGRWPHPFTVKGVAVERRGPARPSSTQAPANE